MGPNPWNDLKLKPLTPEQEARFRELVSRPIIDPPFHGEQVGWDIYLEGLEEQ